MNTAKPWLVLFDIDDTLVRRVHEKEVGIVRWQHAIQNVFHVDFDIASRTHYRGWVDYQIGWDLVKDSGISLDEYEKKFGNLREALYQEAINQVKDIGPLYEMIPDSMQLAAWLGHQEGIFLGLLTGNLEKVGWWKLNQAGIKDTFSFGLFSDNVKDRKSIALQAFIKAKEHFGIDFKPNQITVIGDTIYDIRCGKAIQANAIGFLSDAPESRGPLIEEGADIVVDSLMDKKIIDWFTI